MLAEPAYELVLQEVERWLHPRERERLSGLKAPKRHREFLLGRVAAKQAIAMLCPDLASPDVAINPGVFQQPVVCSPAPSPLGLSITHSGRLASAVAFPAGHPLGIDIEQIDESHLAAMQSQISASETLPASPGSSEAERFTRIWTIKESLSKVLGCGLMTPFRLFTLADAAFSSDGSYRGGFEHFPQYRFISIMAPHMAFTLVHPARTSPMADWHRLSSFMADRCSQNSAMDPRGDP